MKFQNVSPVKCFMCNYPDNLSVKYVYIYIYIYLKNEKNRVKEIIEKGGERERGMKREEAAEGVGLVIA